MDREVEEYVVAGGCDGGGNHYQNKRPYMDGHRGSGAGGGCGSLDKRVRLNNQGNPPHGIDWA